MGNDLISEWNTFGGEGKGFARYRIGETEPSAVHLDNPDTLHNGQTHAEGIEVDKHYCGSEAAAQ